MRLDPLVRLVPGRGEVSEGQQPLGIFIRVRVCEGGRAPQARHAPREQVLLIGGKVVARLGWVALLPESRTRVGLVR